MHKQFQLCLDTVFRPVYQGLLEVGTLGPKVKPWITPNTLRLFFRDRFEELAGMLSWD